jgi:antitoxin MazE
MELTLTKIGNSQGIILPKVLIRQFGFRDQIHVELTDRGLVLTPAAPHPRAGWAEQIEKAIALYGIEDDENVWPEDMEDSFDSEWVWDPKSDKS